MAGALSKAVDRVWRHPVWTAIGTLTAAAAAIESAIHGAESYIARLLHILSTRVTLPLWVVLLAVVGPAVLAWYVRSWRDAATKPDEAIGLRWRVTWEGRRVRSLAPVCPNANCKRELAVGRAGDRYGEDAVFHCPPPGCGFRLRYEDPIPTAMAHATRELEAKSRGEPPPEFPRHMRLYSV